MSAPSPMEISLQNPQDTVIPDQNGVIAVDSAPSPSLPQDKVLVSVEVSLKPSSTARIDDVRSAVERMLEKRSLSYTDGPVPVPPNDQFLTENVQRICICDTDEWVQNHEILLFWQVKPVVHVFQLSEEGACEDVSGDGQPSTFNEWILPAKEFDGMWESLIYESGLKQRLLRYAASALLFTEKALFFYMDLQALEKPLYVKHWLKNYLFDLTPVNGSREWQIGCKAFPKNSRDGRRGKQSDEVESLAAARKAALSGSEPSDSIRVVNALLTQLDKLKSAPNVIILTTSNITAAIDIAFVDRADIKAYVGPPTLQARYEILRSCLQELIRTGILSNFEDCESLMLPNYGSLKEKLNMPEVQDARTLHMCKQLLETAEACEGLSGRSLRKLPFLGHAALASPYGCDPSKFLSTMIDTARRERSEIPD
ncbi:P-loop containing nucleoside triphosphate hydrolases superfamily protein [Prunus dulcis]|uniref:Pachytene checkpoint protein 2 homolog n=1 Tax=Prunus dulcis TaxID=3755 RepID=A0A4Y1RJ67_PRUDU|nr:P-loop containing nucleoside triphosphate hydrolases superfamily protein [Prunus dulcis]